MLVTGSKERDQRYLAMATNCVLHNSLSLNLNEHIMLHIIILSTDVCAPKSWSQSTCPVAVLSPLLLIHLALDLPCCRLVTRAAHTSSSLSHLSWLLLRSLCLTTIMQHIANGSFNDDDVVEGEHWARSSRAWPCTVTTATAQQHSSTAAQQQKH